MKLKGDVLPSITPQRYNIFVAMSRKNKKKSVHPLISEKRKVKNEKFFTFNYSLFIIRPHTQLWALAGYTFHFQRRVKNPFSWKMEKSLVMMNDFVICFLFLILFLLLYFFVFVFFFFFVFVLSDNRDSKYRTRRVWGYTCYKHLWLFKL